MSPAKPPADPLDPKGLMRESFRMEGITEPECRSIFVDWALSLEASAPRPAIDALLVRYGDAPADHPMLRVLREGLSEAPRGGRRGGRAARVTEG
jgi:hypothetical protein